MLGSLNEMARSELGASFFFVHDYPRDIYELWRNAEERPGFRQHIMEFTGEFVRGIDPPLLPAVLWHCLDDFARSEDTEGLTLNGDLSPAERLVRILGGLRD